MPAGCSGCSAWPVPEQLPFCSHGLFSPSCASFHLGLFPRDAAHSQEGGISALTFLLIPRFRRFAFRPWPPRPVPFPSGSGGPYEPVSHALGTFWTQPHPVWVWSVLGNDLEKKKKWLMCSSVLLLVCKLSGKGSGMPPLYNDTPQFIMMPSVCLEFDSF